MNCKDVNKLLLGYLDEEVSPEEREAIEAHLSACSSCREEMEALAKTQRELRQAFKAITARVSPSPYAWATIKQQLITEEHRRARILDLAKSKMEEGVEILKSRRPVWQTALVSALSIALVLGLCLTIPTLLRQPSVETRVANIAENDPQVKAFLGEEGTLKGVVPIEGAEGTTFYRATYALWGHPETGEGQMIVDAMVNLDDERVISVEMGYVPPLSEEQKQRAIEIAKNDPRIGEQATVLEAMALPVYSASAALQPETIRVSVALELNDKCWLAEVDLIEGKVTEVAEE